MANAEITIERHRPEFLHNKPHFTNLIVTEGGRTVHLSGLLAATKDGKLMGAGDLGAQMAYIFGTIRDALETVGATPAHVVRQRIFIVGMKQEHRAAVAKAMNDFYGDGGSATSTCVGVEALLTDGALVEIDVTAVI
ncbi:MAG: RidA family protein [Proteobacteria bacterium]|nr:RidA family protein [Pseudomonadota bacterium]